MKEKIDALESRFSAHWNAIENSRIFCDKRMVEVNTETLKTRKNISENIRCLSNELKEDAKQRMCSTIESVGRLLNEQVKKLVAEMTITYNIQSSLPVEDGSSAGILEPVPPPAAVEPPQVEDCVAALGVDQDPETGPPLQPM